MAEIATCSRCQGELAADAPEGLCPACLIRQALDGQPEEGERATGPSPGPQFVPPAPGELARSFPQFEILSLLGQGGMGAVYLARQTKLDRQVAIKILPPEVARDPAFAERFLREARALARLSHPHIITIHDFGEVDGLYYFTMEYVDGQSLRDLLQAGPISAAQARDLAGQTCEALQYAHDEGLVHRDIKPENILLDRKGRVKIADFGLARLVGLTPTYLTLTGTHEVMGTLLYMAPEQMKQARSVDHRADLYSLGVILYEMLTGELPMGRFAPPSRKAAVDERLDHVVLKALAREPAERYQDAAALKQDLDRALAAAPIPERPRSAMPLASIPPSFRFTVLNGWLVGMAHLDSETLILEFQPPRAGIIDRVKHFFQEPIPQERRIPLQEIASLSFGWGWGRPPCSVILRVRRLAILAGMPGSRLGQVQLQIPRADRDAARQLIETLGHTRPGGPRLPFLDRVQAREAVTIPALGLTATGFLAVASLALLAMIFGNWSTHPLFLVPMVFTPLAVLLLLGGLSLLRLRHYPLVATASIVAMVPWSPAFLIGLPFGIWTCVLLGKPEVAAVFWGTSDFRGHELAAGSDRPPRSAGRALSFVRSVVGYILPTMAGRESESAGHNPQSSR
jgi:serine/threonine protein kinase